MNHFLLVAVNAKYIHTNLAVRDLQAYADPDRKYTEIAEYTINQSAEEILEDLFSRRPRMVAFSCYLWNIRMVAHLVRDFHLLCPDVPIWLGGPEVSYDAEEELNRYPEIKGVMCGEGEKPFSALLLAYRDAEKGGANAAPDFSSVPGIVWREEKGGTWEVCRTPLDAPVSLDEVPFVYDVLPEDGEHRILYYESSRGCPFSCSYCLSSLEKVRFRSLPLVQKELQFFLDHRVPQVKFVDRTFNCNHAHAQAIWTYLREHDNQVTNFHFEIEADLLNAEELALLGTLRPGLVQLEIGVQSANPDTIREIDRTMQLEKLQKVTAVIRRGRNIHQHLDLIAGLPEEGYESFAHSFDVVYEMRPQQFQLGFLKVLKGSAMQKKTVRYALVYSTEPPYEVLQTRWLSYPELRKLKKIEELLDVYYNSQQFRYTMELLVHAFSSPFQLYEALAVYYEREGLFGVRHARLTRFSILREFGKRVVQDRELLDETLILDLYLRENSKSRPDWAPAGREKKEAFLSWFRREAENPQTLRDYAGYSARQMERMTHSEVFFHNPGSWPGEGPWYVIFDYQKRDPLTGDAGLVFLGEKNLL